MDVIFEIFRWFESILVSIPLPPQIITIYKIMSPVWIASIEWKKPDKNTSGRTGVRPSLHDAADDDGAPIRIG